jgi:hypothetical protein
MSTVSRSNRARRGSAAWSPVLFPRPCLACQHHRTSSAASPRQRRAASFALFVPARIFARRRSAVSRPPPATRPATAADRVSRETLVLCRCAIDVDRDFHSLILPVATARRRCANGSGSFKRRCIPRSGVSVCVNSAGEANTQNDQKRFQNHESNCSTNVLQRNQVSQSFWRFSALHSCGRR